MFQSIDFSNQNNIFNWILITDCNCDPRGTIKEICDKENGMCICKPGYGGARCDQCQPGYWGHPDCKPCNCSESGSASSICTPNGKCPCLPNFSGRTCDQCSPGYYKYPGCLSKFWLIILIFKMKQNIYKCHMIEWFLGCNCDTSGSLGVSCDDEGRCQCRSNFDGHRCDRCRETFYNYPACEGNFVFKMKVVIIYIEIDNCGR